VSIKPFFKYLGNVLEVVVTETNVNDVLLKFAPLVDRFVGLIQLNL
jgi:hypothetical protein